MVYLSSIGAPAPTLTETRFSTGGSQLLGSSILAPPAAPDSAVVVPRSSFASSAPWLAYQATVPPCPSDWGGETRIIVNVTLVQPPSHFHLGSESRLKI